MQFEKKNLPVVLEEMSWVPRELNFKHINYLSSVWDEACQAILWILDPNEILLQYVTHYLKLSLDVSCKPNNRTAHKTVHLHK